MQQPENTVSLEVLLDRWVIFRLFAPNAKNVTIHGDHPPGDKYLGAVAEMSRDKQGI